MIEHAGADFDIAWKLSMQIFQGEDVPEEIGEQDEEYLRIKEERVRANLPADSPAVLRSRRKVIQHAKSAAFMITKPCIHDQDLSEEIMCLYPELSIQQP
ncbi:uncharacterized protein N7482_004117 [Penicillium canariense]|uniref:Uncharacterized protein n=1 Tax=Penicillium canariense TaxID=189055 RepID=A0A9W9I850_9EURO|nr:uncharacterized protein N7482_004117 [Penicillium canariense]KAJ5168523.1 hypothetical protein N7482_004117 [Penicillium canariense]